MFYEEKYENQDESRSYVQTETLKVHIYVNELS